MWRQLVVAAVFVATSARADLYLRGGELRPTTIDPATVTVDESGTHSLNVIDFSGTVTSCAMTQLRLPMTFPRHATIGVELTLLARTTSTALAAFNLGGACLRQSGNLASSTLSGGPVATVGFPSVSVGDIFTHEMTFPVSSCEAGDTLAFAVCRQGATDAHPGTIGLTAVRLHWPYITPTPTVTFTVTTTPTVTDTPTETPTATPTT